MTLTNVLPWIQRAQQEGSAVGAFNANTLEQIQAVADAAEAEQAPAIIQISHRALLYVGSGDPMLGLRIMSGIGKTVAESVSVPLSLHLDHADEAEVLEALQLGFTSVMFDGGELPFDQNISVTHRLCEQAHSHGVCMEAELGEVPRMDISGQLNHSAEATNPHEAAEYVRVTGVDTLAVSIGSVHAIQKKNVALDLELLKAIRAEVAVPLVLHGSSGVTNEHIAAGIRMGLAKINVATQLNQAFTGAVRQILADVPGEWDPRKYLGPARAAMIEAVRERIRFVGAAGKA